MDLSAVLLFLVAVISAESASDHYEARMVNCPGLVNDMLLITLCYWTQKRLRRPYVMG